MPTWGDHPASGRRRSPRKGSAGRRRTDRARHKKARRRARHKRSGCRGIVVGLVVGCGLWAVLLVPLILWGPL